MARLGDLEHATLAALIRARFPDGPIAAWSRLFQNSGWDDASGIREWHAMADRGDAFLQAAGMRLPAPPSDL